MELHQLRYFCAGGRYRAALAAAPSSLRLATLPLAANTQTPRRTRRPPLRPSRAFRSPHGDRESVSPRGPRGPSRSRGRSRRRRRASKTPSAVSLRLAVIPTVAPYLLPAQLTALCPQISSGGIFLVVEEITPPPLNAFAPGQHRHRHPRAPIAAHEI